MFSLFAHGNGDYIDVKDVDVLGTGTWLTKNGPTPVDQNYIDIVAKNINSGEFAAVGLSFGHNTDPQFVQEMSEALGMGKIALTGGPDGAGSTAHGTVANARTNAGKLFVDIVNVPKKLAERIGKEFINVSPTIVDYWPGSKGNIVKGPVMIALGLLGGEHPAFSVQKGLAHAQQLASQFGGEFDSNAITVFTGIRVEEETTEESEMPPKENEEGTPAQQAPVQVSMPPEMVSMFSGISDLLKKQDERMAKIEADNFRQTVQAAASEWHHITDETEKNRLIGVITEFSGTAPEAAQSLMSEHAKLGALAKNGQQQQQQQQQRQNNQPGNGWFNRQSMFAGNGNHNPAYDSFQGETPHKVVMRGVQRYMQERGVDYIEAREMYSQTDEGRAAIRAAEAQNELLNGGGRAMMERMPAPNYRTDASQPIGAMQFGGGDGQQGEASNLDELRQFFQMARSQMPAGENKPGPGEEPMTVGVLPNQ